MQLVAELLRARSGRLHGGDEVRLRRVRVEHRDRALGGAALGRDLRAQDGRRQVRRLRELDRAREGRVRELARLLVAEAELARRILEGFEEVEDVRGPARADPGDGVEHVLARNPHDLAHRLEHAACERAAIVVDDNPERLLDTLAAIDLPNVPKWIRPDET